MVIRHCYRVLNLGSYLLFLLLCCCCFCSVNILLIENEDELFRRIRTILCYSTKSFNWLWIWLTIYLVNCSRVLVCERSLSLNRRCMYFRSTTITTSAVPHSGNGMADSMMIVGSATTVDDDNDTGQVSYVCVLSVVLYVSSFAWIPIYCHRINEQNT